MLPTLCRALRPRPTGLSARSLASYTGRGRRSPKRDPQPVASASAPEHAPAADSAEAIETRNADSEGRSPPAEAPTANEPHVFVEKPYVELEGSLPRRSTIQLLANDWVTRICDVGHFHPEDGPIVDRADAMKHMESMPQPFVLRVVRGAAEGEVVGGGEEQTLWRTKVTREADGVGVRRGDDAAGEEVERSLRFSAGSILDWVTDGHDGRPAALLRAADGSYIPPEDGGVFWGRLRGAEGWVFLEDVGAILALSLHHWSHFLVPF